MKEPTKAILVIDMPKSCEDCELCRDGYLCLRLGEIDESVEYGTKDLRCPLKPLPHKTQENYMVFGDEVVWQKAVGYNWCLDEILGGNE